MAKNKIQFQQGFSLQAFISQYGCEQQCRQALIQWRWPQGFQCPVCGHDQYCELTTRLLFQCNRCRTQTSVTAGTIFDSTKLPLTTWFFGIYHITQSKISISALSLKRTIGVVAYNTALLMKHKVQQAMKERDDSKPLTYIVQLDDAYWGGKKRDGKRGRGATGKIRCSCFNKRTGSSYFTLPISCPESDFLNNWGSEYQEKVNKNNSLLLRQHFPITA